MRKNHAAQTRRLRASWAAVAKPGLQTAAIAGLSLLVLARSPGWPAGVSPGQAWKPAQDVRMSQSIGLPVRGQGLRPASAAVISSQQAIVRALNDLKPIEGGVHLSHPRHRVSFTSEGIDFRPRHGGPAWHWKLDHVGDGVNALPQVVQSGVDPLRGGPTDVRLARGALVERYVAKADGIEQQFVIGQRLSLQGADLVIRGTVRSTGTFEATRHGWLWHTPEGVVSLGKVHVHDARGRRVPATMDVKASETSISIDGAALEQAEYPVTVDPEVGTNDFRISDMGPDGNGNFGAHFFSNVAVAYNSTNNEYLVVWAGDDDTAPLVDGELEIFGQRINAATGAEVGINDFRISDMGPDGNAGFSPYFSPPSPRHERMSGTGENEENRHLETESEGWHSGPKPL